MVMFNFCEATINKDDLPDICKSVWNDKVYAYVYNKLECKAVYKEDSKTNTLASDLRVEQTEYVAGVNLTYESGSTTCLTNPSEQFLFNVLVFCSDD